MLQHQHARSNMLNRVTDCKKQMKNVNRKNSTKSIFLRIYLEKYTQISKLATQISSEEPRNENKWMLSPTLPPQKIARTHTHTHTQSATYSSPSPSPFSSRQQNIPKQKTTRAITMPTHTHALPHAPAQRYKKADSTDFSSFDL